MLRRLSIRDIVLIDALDLDFEHGLNVLTGETGAGKSIMLDALGLAIGERGGAGLVRAGAERGAVSAAFEVSGDHPARAALRKAGFDDEEELILRRVVGVDGRGKAFVNGQPASVSTLRALGETLVEIHGQHDDRGLLNAAGHRALLDVFAGLGADLAENRNLWRAATEAGEAYEADLVAIDEARRDADFIHHSLGELNALAPEPGEADALDAERRLMQAAEKIRGEILIAADAMGAGSAEGALADAVRRLDFVADKAEGQLDAPLAALDRAMVELGEAQRGVDAALDALSFEPHRLEAAEERLFALRALARKHRIAPDELPSLRDRMTERLAFIKAGEEKLAALAAAADAAQVAHRTAAARLHDSRMAAAARLDAAVAEELAPLKMERAMFCTQVERLPDDRAGPEGVSRVSFQVTTNPGSKPGPLDKIASGGELSRFLLALKVRLTPSGAGVSMIFDEIDRGVGGATADAVGARLARLAGEAQVLVVTHSPQVAAKGAHHWRIEKREEGGVTRTCVSPLSAPERIEELARMVAGERVTDAARAAAQSLLNAD